MPQLPQQLKNITPMKPLCKDHISYFDLTMTGSVFPVEKLISDQSLAVNEKMFECSLPKNAGSGKH